MKEQLLRRLEELKAEYESGQKMLAELEAKQSEIKETLLRIRGAIQVLEEMLAQAESPPSGMEKSEPPDEERA
jgi:predicted nuclease with TOPRIM domain